MALLKCKMCGGDIIAQEGQTYGECDCCGSTVTLPRVDDQRMENLFNRANHFRMVSEFDKAVSTYEMILNEDNTNAEAHWGLLISRYGIEYVEDPISHERIPTCHRIQMDSILSDDDYLAALEYAPDGYTRSLYEAEGKRLSELQKGLLQVSAQTEPYDIFICYKETTPGGSRTKDSTLAQDIYYQLTNAGYKVFFSRVTLENMLGQQYEPHIFAALNSAKVMLAIGTKPEYFNAVWVKNEWSRFLALIKKDRSKVLIPCYMDMNVYDLPDELSMLQSQDMSKLGFMQDLMRGIEKIVRGGKKEEKKPEAAPAASAPGVESLRKRAVLFLEDGDFDSAAEYADKILDINPEYAPAYIIKVQVTKKCRTEAELANCKVPLADDADYKKALRFANAQQKAVYQGYNQTILDRIEEEKKAAAYREAERIQKDARTADDYLAAAKQFDALGDYSDAQARVEECLQQEAQKRAEEAEAARLEAERKEAERLEQERLDEQRRIEAEKEEALIKKIILILVAVAAVAIVVTLLLTQYIIPNSHYSKGKEMLSEGKYLEAISAFEEAGAYGDAEERIPETYYAYAETLLNEGKYVEAYVAFNAAGSYSDAAERLSETYYAYAETLLNEGKYVEAYVAFNAAAGYSDAKARSEQTAYNQAVISLEQGKNAEALIYFRRAGDYENSREQALALQNTLSASIAAGTSHTVGLKSDGTVVAVGSNGDGQCKVSGWRDIVAVAAGYSHTVGLKADSTVVAVGDNDYGQCKVSGWRDIVAVAADYEHTVGLKSDGKVVAVGVNVDGRCAVSGWKDIVAVAAGHSHTVGLKADGTVVAVGSNYFGQCNVSGWKDIVAVAAGEYHTVGLKSDGTVVAVGYNFDGQCNVSGWDLWD